MTPGRSMLLFFAIVAGGLGWLALNNGLSRPDGTVAGIVALAGATVSADTLAARFDLCAGAVRINCVVDGDTLWFRGEKIRVADIDAPEISQPACAAERQAGEMSRDRLLAMLNEGSFSLAAGSRDEDRYGRKLRVVSRSGRSLGERLVDEGLARRWNEPDIRWCGEDTPVIGDER